MILVVHFTGRLFLSTRTLITCKRIRREPNYSLKALAKVYLRARTIVEVSVMNAVIEENWRSSNNYVTRMTEHEAEK